VRSFLAWPPGELEEWCAAHGGRPFHARAARREILERGISDYGAMTSLPTALREALAAEIPLLASRELERRRSGDGVTKLLIEFAGREGAQAARIETVYIPPRHGGAGRGATLCVSTQVGCPVACPFCASGLEGLERNLAPHEILEQFLRGRALGSLSRAVVMGIGEPLLNYRNLATALEVVTDELGLGSRKITVSTVGFPDRLRRVARSDPRFQLAISLHTPDDEERARLVPAMAGIPIAEVLSAGDDWFEVTGREVTYEVVLLGGQNDTSGHAQRLAERLSRRRATVNLIPFNPVPGLPFRRPEAAAVEGYREGLASSGVVATVRWSRGVEEAAACGQLRLRH